MPVDYLKFTVGFEKRGDNLKLLVKESYQTMLDLKQLLLKDLNLPDTLVMTDESSVRKYRRREKIYFRFEQSMTVLLDSLALYETLRRDLIKTGATEIAITYFGNFNPQKYKEKARQQAYKNALEKAEGLASAVGMSIGKPHIINMGRTYINLDADFDLNELVVTSQSKIAPPGPVLESTLIKKYKKVEADVSIKFEME